MSYYLVPNMDAVEQSGAIKESGSTYECPENFVMIARKHDGDENGHTYYQAAPLMVDPSHGGAATVTISDTSGWLDAGKQSKLNYQAPEGYVITGRKHDGDENGHTYFKISRVFVSNTIANTVDQVTSGKIKESKGTWYYTPDIGTMKGAITGMSHSGDENGDSTYTSNLIYFPG